MLPLSNGHTPQWSYCLFLICRFAPAAVIGCSSLRYNASFCQIVLEFVIDILRSTIASDYFDGPPPLFLNVVLKLLEPLERFILMSEQVDLSESCGLVLK